MLFITVNVFSQKDDTMSENTATWLKSSESSNNNNSNHNSSDSHNSNNEDDNHYNGEDHQPPVAPISNWFYIPLCIGIVYGMYSANKKKIKL